jgi:NAD(P)-dependent dehydrogenase (short-subunit alcohol dehydrogenase family)
MAANDSVRKARAVQKHVNRLRPRKAAKHKSSQTGQRRYPAKFPAQHLVKPGMESELKSPPMFEAPGYIGSHKLKDMVALITGGDSGIGRAVAVLYAREGADVAIVYLNEHEDAKATRQAVEAEGRRCILLPGDVSDASFCKAAVAKVVSKFGCLDIVVSNAAFQQHAQSIDHITDEHFDLTLKTNLYGAFYLLRAAMPHLKPGSSIILTGSVTGLMGSGELLDYSMTKGGLHAFARSLSSNLLPKGIRVNAIAPGPVWTPLNPADRKAKDVATFGAHTPMKRAAQPEEIAPAFVFFASPCCSSYITGEILPIIGGYS